jgi:hypothetical protein
VDVAETLTARLIGTVFVERGLLSESQIRVALEIQRETGQQLGQILVERFGVSRQELASVVAEQWAEIGRSGSDIDPATNESWRRLGDIFVERGFVTPEQLEQALVRQRETGERVGEALVAQGSISKFELAGALAEQASALDLAAAEQAAAAQTETTPAPAPAEATVVSLAPRLEEPAAAAAPEPGIVIEIEPEPELAEIEDASEPEVEPEREPRPPVSVVTSLPIAVVQPEAQPSFGWVAFASTTTGYRLFQLSGAIPAIGSTVDIPELGERVVLRLGRSPLWQDQRTCVFLEQLAPEPALVA